MGTGIIYRNGYLSADTIGERSGAHLRCSDHGAEIAWKVKQHDTSELFRPFSSRCRSKAHDCVGGARRTRKEITNVDRYSI
jgi:hypothetical protein